jgi:flagellar P-ring protein FlgI
MYSHLKLSSLFLMAAVTALTMTFRSGADAAQARIKDISRIAGLEPMQLIGYGIVVGLNGSGDKDLTLTRQTMANLLEQFQITISPDDVKSKNVAAVIVTASAPPFHNKGGKIDITVSSVGDATSLEGGTLLMTPLLEPSGEVAALAQGGLTVGGYSAGQGGAGGSTVVKNHTTVAMIPAGATLKSSLAPKFVSNGTMKLILNSPDFTTASRIAAAINQDMGGLAVAKDASTVSVRVPEEFEQFGQTTAFIAKLEALRVRPDVRARVIVNERTGTIVMGSDVSISAAVVAHGDLTVNVKETRLVSQPANLTLVNPAPGDIRTEVVPDVTTTVTEDTARVMMLPDSASVRDLADTLNLLGATPRDLISILEALHNLGALQMELVTM